MNKVKFYPEDPDDVRFGITIGKIYDVLEYYHGATQISFLIENDYGVEREYFFVSYQDKVLFVDANVEYRNRVIDEILI